MAKRRITPTTLILAAVEKRSAPMPARPKTVMKSPGAISNSRRLARKGEAQGCAEYEIAGSDFKQPQAGPQGRSAGMR
jgi:hypothetical protein